jgi:hypothetical protein
MDRFLDWDGGGGLSCSPSLSYRIPKQEPRPPQQGLDQEHRRSFLDRFLRIPSPFSRPDWRPAVSSHQHSGDDLGRKLPAKRVWIRVRRGSPALRDCSHRLDYPAAPCWVGYPTSLAAGSRDAGGAALLLGKPGMDALRKCHGAPSLRRRYRGPDRIGSCDDSVLSHQRIKPTKL